MRPLGWCDPLVVLGLVFWAPATDPSRAVASPAAAAPSYEPALHRGRARRAERPGGRRRAPAKRAAPERALFFGDSLFIGGGYTTEENSMARLAGQPARAPPRLVNGGGGTGYVTANPEYDLGTYLEQIATGAFDVRPPAWSSSRAATTTVGYPVDTSGATPAR